MGVLTPIHHASNDLKGGRQAQTYCEVDGLPRRNPGLFTARWPCLCYDMVLALRAVAIVAAVQGIDVGEFSRTPSAHLSDCFGCYRPVCIAVSAL